MLTRKPWTEKGRATYSNSGISKTSLPESAEENIGSRFADWFYLLISPASEARFIDNLVAQ